MGLEFLSNITQKSNRIPYLIIHVISDSDSTKNASLTAANGICYFETLGIERVALSVIMDSHNKFCGVDTPHTIFVDINSRQTELSLNKFDVFYLDNDV